MKYRAYITTSTNPYENLAMEEYLFRFAEPDSHILYLWQNEDTIVLGRNQQAEEECRMEEFLASGGTIARRRSGGGAVYHDLGNLNFSIIGTKNNMSKNLYQSFLTELLEGLGLSPECSGRNDITINGLKCSGNAFFDDGKIVCQHGTLLVHTDFDRMTHFLTPNQEKLKRHKIRSVSSRVMNLSSLLPEITVQKLIDKILTQTGAELFSVNLTEDLKTLRNKYQNNQWIYGGVS